MRKAPVVGLLSALLALTPACYLSHERLSTPGDAGADAAAAPEPSVVWVLVHPSDAPRGAGIYRYDEARREIVGQLPLPSGVESPHGLAWDGTSLWLADIVTSSIYELDPADGAVRSTWPGILAEGVAVDSDGTVWYAGGIPGGASRLGHRTRTGDEISLVPLPADTVQDLAIANGNFYYLVNDDVDRIVRVDPPTGRSTDVARGVYVAPYSLGFDGTNLAVAVDGMIRRFDPTTGALVRVSPFAVPGWITAIAFGVR